jgi:hypothetical protein
LVHHEQAEHEGTRDGPWSTPLMKSLGFSAASLLAVAALSAAPRPQTFTGTVTDSVCGNAGHAGMRMGPTDAECTIACVDAHGAAYVLFDGKHVYTLSDQRTPEKFAGHKVTVKGTLDAKTQTIRVDSIAAAK